MTLREQSNDKVAVAMITLVSYQMDTGKDAKAACIQDDTVMDDSKLWKVRKSRFCGELRPRSDGVRA